MKWNARLILACDFAELVALCKVIFWKTHIPVRTPKWPPHLIFAGACHSIVINYVKGCPVHPTTVDSSLVFAIRLTGNRFVNPILASRHVESLLLLIRHARSRFAWDFENIADLGFEGVLKMLSIQVDLIKSTQIISPARGQSVMISLFKLYGSVFNEFEKNKRK